MLMCLVIIIVLMVIYHCYSHYGKRGKIINKIPGPKVAPVFGSIFQYNLPNDLLWKSQRKLNAEYYPISRLWLGHKPVINIFHPDDIQILLSSTKHIEKNLFYNLLHPWLGTGLLTSSGSKWQHRRKMLTPAFHFNILQGFAEVFIKHAQELVEDLKPNEGNSVIKDIVPLFKKYTLKSICEIFRNIPMSSEMYVLKIPETAMGTSLNKLGKEEDYAYAVREFGGNIFYRIPRPWFHIDWIFGFSPKGCIQQKCIEILHGFSTKIIKERRKHLEQRDNDKANDTTLKKSHVKDDFNVRKPRMAMLDILLSSQKLNGDIDDVGIREEVDTFVFEGHDTTAMGFVFTVALLAEYTEVQEKARKEVCEILAQNGGKMGVREINSFNYLDRCIKEGLRLYPSVSSIARNINEDLQLKHCSVPAGSMIHVHFFDLHRLPSYWPDPEVFDPDRFLPDVVQERHPFAYVPFSAGPRNCIGQKFAMLELKAMIGHLLYHFEMEAIDLAHEAVILQDMVITPANPMRVKFTKRI